MRFVAKQYLKSKVLLCVVRIPQNILSIEQHANTNYDYFKMAFPLQERTNCVIWYTESRSIVVTQRKFRQKYGLNASTPSNKSIKKWYEKFKSTETMENLKAHRPTVLNTQGILDYFIENPKTCLWRCAILFGMS